jgi:transmembrane sensor
MNQSIVDNVPEAAMTIAETAAYWWVRHDAGAMTVREQQAFKVWHAASPEHRDAYERAQTLWHGFEEEADSTELRALRTAALGVPRQNKVWPRLVAVVLLFGVATSFAIKLASPGRIGLSSRISTAAQADREEHTTAGNERSTVTLSDGTIVTLNRDTTLDVAFTTAERRVRIMRGQAFFEVAKNPHRPFVVAVADRTVTALGTQFDVRSDPDRLEVILVEGKVAVDHADPTMLERLRLRKAHLELKPGEKLVAALGEPLAVTHIDAERDTSWRRGWVTFENESVVNVVAELNRYSDRQISAPDDSLRNLRLSGVFRIGQPDRFAEIIEELLPVKAVPGRHGEILLIRTEPGTTSFH